MKALYFISFIVFITAMISMSESKGGRGGGGRGGRGGSRGGSRASYSRMPSRYNARGWTSSAKRTALNAGSIYMASRFYHLHWRTSRRDYDDIVYGMDICRNIQKYPKYNSTTEIYGWFLCPTDNYTVDDKYCCGSADKEFCCAYWQSQRGVNTIIAIVTCGLIAIGFVVYCIIKYHEYLLAFFAALLCYPCKKCRNWMRRPPRQPPAQPAYETSTIHEPPPETYSRPPPPAFKEYPSDTSFDASRSPKDFIMNRNAPTVNGDRHSYYQSPPPAPVYQPPSQPPPPYEASSEYPSTAV